jgi:hypothetical protein
MMMLGEWLTGREPFRVVYLHGMVRDPLGAKMSKTKGNVVDPLEVVKTMGADAMRFALVHGSEPSADQKLSDTRIEGARNFANKLWNAARFVVNSRPAEIPADAPLEPPTGRWVRPSTGSGPYRGCREAAERHTPVHVRRGHSRAVRLTPPGTTCATGTWRSRLGLGSDGTPERRVTTGGP